MSRDRGPPPSCRRRCCIVHSPGGARATRTHAHPDLAGDDAATLYRPTTPYSVPALSAGVVAQRCGVGLANSDFRRSQVSYLFEGRLSDDSGQVVNTRLSRRRQSSLLQSRKTKPGIFTLSQSQITPVSSDARKGHGQGSLRAEMQLATSAQLLSELETHATTQTRRFIQSLKLCVQHARHDVARRAGRLRQLRLVKICNSEAECVKVLISTVTRQ